MKLLLAAFSLFGLLFSIKNSEIQYSPGKNNCCQTRSDTIISTEELLKRCVLELQKYPDSVFYLRSDADEDCAENPLIAGKLIDDAKFYAVDYSCKDSLISFYQLEGATWKNVGSEKTNIDVYAINFVDLDGDGRSEVLTSTGANMNGNSWKEVYYCSKNKDSIRYAGNFSSDYSVNLLKKRIEVDYSGSWYMDQIKTVYEWHDEKLIPVKEVVLSLKRADWNCHKQIIRYYENPTRDTDTLELKFKKRFREKYYDMWEHFFDQ